MDSQSFLGWLFSDAGAGWFVALIMAIGLIWSLLSRKKPQKVVCKEIDQSSLNFSEIGGKKIEPYFDKRLLDEPYFLRLALYNKGAEIIKNIELTVQFAPKTKIVDAYCKAVDDSCEIIEDGQELNNRIIGNQVVLNIPFLNPIRPHKHTIFADILCDGDTEGFKVLGSGEGWSVKTIRIPSIKQMRKTFLPKMLGAFLLGIICSGVMLYFLMPLLPLSTFVLLFVIIAIAICGFLIFAFLKIFF